LDSIRQPTEAEIAWAAGLFEGEGCISFGRSAASDYRLPQMTIVMTDRDVLERFQAVVGGNLSGKPFRRAEHVKEQWSWRIHGKPAYAVYLRLRPWLCERRRQRGDEVFAHLNNRGPGGHPITEVAPDDSAKRCTGCQEMKTATEFNRSRNGILGRESVCRDCKHALYRAYWLENTEAIRARNRESKRRYDARARS
jgi:hypothetical protein